MNEPKKLGPFQIMHVIGRGGMGAVYEAIHEETKETVALKVLSAHQEDRELQSRFESEIGILKRLRHPNIVRLYGFGQEEGQLYYAMEYVDGPSLQYFLKKARLFSWEETIHIGIEVCKALKHAHDRGIIHRDIKPANILLLRNGQIKVSDYGIAHFFGDSRLTTDNMVIGTIEYMAPEQAQAGPLTPKSDLYSLGALLYALLTGRPPYVARSLSEIHRQYQMGPPESCRFSRPEIPSVLDQLLMELMRIQVDKRPNNAQVVGRRLEAIRLAYSPQSEKNLFLEWGMGAENVISVAERKSSKTDESFSYEKSEDAPYQALDSSLEDEGSVERGSSSAVASRSASQNSKTSNTQTNNLEAFQADHPEKKSSDFDLNYCQETLASSIDQFPADPSELTHDQHHIPTEELQFDMGAAVIPSEFDCSFETIRESSDVADALDGGENKSSFVFSSVPKEERFVSRRDDRQTAPLVSDLSDDQEMGDASVVAEPATLWATDPQLLKEKEKINVSERPSGKQTVHSENLHQDQSSEKGDSPPSSPPKALDVYAIRGEKNSEEKVFPRHETKGPLAEGGWDNRSRYVRVQEDELDAPRTNSREYPLVSPTVWGGLSILIAIGLLFWYSLRSPDADTLYSKIERQIENSESKEYLSALRGAEKVIDRFLSLYPNDVRAAKISGYSSEIELGMMERRLERQIEQSSKNRTLSPVESAYVEAIRIANADPEEGIKRLEAFIDLFSIEIPDNANEKFTRKDDLSLESRKERRELHRKTIFGQCVILAQRRLDLIRTVFEQRKKEQAEMLTDRLDYADSIEIPEPERARQIRRAIVTLYSGHEWAQPFVKRARQKLP